MKIEALRHENPQILPLHIRATSGWVSLKLGELWEYRELLYFLAWRDLKVRYKQSALGVSWVVLQPLLMTLVFSVLFARLAGVSTDDKTPYPVFAFCGLLPWQFFAYVLANSTNSLVASEQLITKIYFPRLVIPLSGAMSGLIDFGFAFVMLVALMVYYEVVPTYALLLLPGFFLLAVLCAVGMGLWLAALNLKYRDVRHTIPFMTQFWFFLSPVAYPTSLVPDQWRWLYGINPMVGVIEGFRWSLLGQAHALPMWFVFSVLVTLFLLVSGLYYFRRMEKTFADMI